MKLQLKSLGLILVFSVLAIICGYFGWSMFQITDGFVSEVELEPIQLDESKVGDMIKIHGTIHSNETFVVSGRFYGGNGRGNWYGKANDFVIEDESGKVNVSPYYSDDRLYLGVYDAPHKKQGTKLDQFRDGDEVWLVGDVILKQGEKVIIMKAISGTEDGFKVNYSFMVMSLVFICLGSGMVSIALMFTYCYDIQDEFEIMVGFEQWKWDSKVDYYRSLAICMSSICPIIFPLVLSDYPGGWFWPVIVFVIFGVVASLLTIGKLISLDNSSQYSHNYTIGQKPIPHYKSFKIANLEQKGLVVELYEKKQSNGMLYTTMFWEKHGVNVILSSNNQDTINKILVKPLSQDNRSRILREINDLFY